MTRVECDRARLDNKGNAEADKDISEQTVKCETTLCFPMLASREQKR